MFVSFLFFPIIGAWSYRYNSVIKPQRKEAKKQAEEALLAEGKYEGN